MICRGPYPVFEMAQHGLLEASGWEDIVGRILIEAYPFGNERLRLRPAESQNITTLLCPAIHQPL